MKRTINTFDEAVAIYTKNVGKAPEVTEMFNLYHEYRKVAKQFNGFMDWMSYEEAEYNMNAMADSNF